MLKPINLLLIVAATTTSLMAGLFYAWSFSVTPGFQKLSDSGYIAAFQACNRAIQNPVFLVCFMGTLLLLPLCTFMHYSQPVSTRFWLLLGASLLYAIGTFGVTITGNVPMNEVMDKFDLTKASAETIAHTRAAFETRWNNLNMIRTVSSILAVLLVIMACMAQPKAIPNVSDPIAGADRTARG